MRHLLIAKTLRLAALILAAAMLAPAVGQAQQPQLPNLRPPPPAPIKPYQAIAVTPPAPFSDPSFVAFRKQLADVVAHKDRAGLAKLVVAQGFFWMQDKDRADKRKSGFDNLAEAVNLNAKDGFGWDALASFADDPTGGQLPEKPKLICAPAAPSFDEKAFMAVVQSTRTDVPEWAYPTQAGVDVRSAAKSDAPVVEKLGMVLVRVLPDTETNGPDQPQFVRVATPSGKTGYVDINAISALGGYAICYSKEASGWKIAGLFGGAEQ
jgi:hypothetical protein